MARRGRHHDRRDGLGRADVDHACRGRGLRALGHVEIGDEHDLAVLRGPGDDAPIAVDHQRGPVEDELVLPADQVDVDDRAAGLARPLGQHQLAPAHLARVVGRAVDVDDELGAGPPSGGDRAVGHPRVLADGQGDPHAADAEQLGRPGAGREVALLVEDLVVRQPLLAIGADDPAVGAHGHGVEQVGPGAVDESDDGRAPPARGGDAIERVAVVASRTPASAAGPRAGSR